MTSWSDALMVALILTDLALLGSGRLGVCIRIVALQGIMLGLLPLLAAQGEPVLPDRDPHRGRAWWSGASSSRISSGGCGFRRRPPRGGAVRRLYPVASVRHLRRRGLHLAQLRGSAFPGRPCRCSRGRSAIFTILVGLFLIVSRKKAISQVLGYLVMENGIYVLGIWMVVEIPMLVELGVLLDAFVAVFVMGIATYHISREFDHIDVDQLDSLKG